MSEARKLKYLVIHCSATPEGKYFDMVDILRWHCSSPPVGRGWRKPGYTDIILLDGTIQNLSPFDQDDCVDGFEVTNGVRGINSISRHVCYIGGLDGSGSSPRDTRTAGQLDCLESYVKCLVYRYPGILVAGHNQFSAKACPSFDVVDWCTFVGIPGDNVYKGKFI